MDCKLIFLAFALASMLAASAAWALSEIVFGSGAGGGPGFTAIQIGVPGGVYLNEAAAVQYGVPGGVYFND